MELNFGGRVAKLIARLVQYVREFLGLMSGDAELAPLKRADESARDERRRGNFLGWEIQRYKNEVWVPFQMSSGIPIFRDYYQAAEILKTIGGEARIVPVYRVDPSRADQDTTENGREGP